MRRAGRVTTWIGAVLAAACGGGGAGDTSATTAGPGDPTATATGSSGPGGTGTGDPTATTSAGPTTSAGTTTSDPTTSGSSGDATTGGPPGCGERVTFATGKAPTQELHVATTGSDAPGCGAEASPCANLGFAIAMAQPGTAVRVHAGTYAADQYVSDVAGTEAAPIWIGGAPGEQRPQIVGGGEALHLTRARYVVVHDLEIHGASGNGINLDDGGAYDDPEAARFVVFERLFIHDIGQGGNEDCLKLSGLNDYFVLDSEFTACGGGGAGSGIDHVGCHRGVIAGNHFHDLSGNAVQAKGGSADLDIVNNRMIEAGERAVNMGGSTGFEFFRPPLVMGAPNAEAQRIRVVANAIVGGQAALAFVGCVDCLAANNTIVRPHHWLLRILQETVSTPEYEFTAASMGRFVNNVVVFDRGEIATYVNIGGDTAPDTFVFDANLWFAADDPAASSPAGDLPVPETGALAGMDPLLVDPVGGDLHLQPGSPAIGSGSPLAELGADLDGECYKDPPSRGADELP